MKTDCKNCAKQCCISCKYSKEQYGELYCIGVKEPFVVDKCHTCVNFKSKVTGKKQFRMTFSLIGGQTVNVVSDFTKDTDDDIRKICDFLKTDNNNIVTMYINSELIAFRPNQVIMFTVEEYEDYK